jgi:hypothetical protein
MLIDHLFLFGSFFAAGLVLGFAITYAFVTAGGKRL